MWCPYSIIYTIDCTHVFSFILIRKIWIVNHILAPLKCKSWKIFVASNMLQVYRCRRWVHTWNRITPSSRQAQLFYHKIVSCKNCFDFRGTMLLALQLSCIHELLQMWLIINYLHWEVNLKSFKQLKWKIFFLIVLLN